MAPAGKVSGLPGKAQGAFRRRLTSGLIPLEEGLKRFSPNKSPASVPTLRANSTRRRIETRPGNFRPVGEVPLSGLIPLEEGLKQLSDESKFFEIVALRANSTRRRIET